MASRRKIQFSSMQKWLLGEKYGLLQYKNGFPKKNIVFFNAEMAFQRKIQFSAI
jgi:tRNA G26 N,N-dimethylase Trm1